MKGKQQDSKVCRSKPDTRKPAEGAKVKKDNYITVLDNGTECEATKDWTPESAAEQDVLAEGWQPGGAIHFTVSQGIQKAIAEQCPEYVKGYFNGTPVIDSEKLVADFRVAFIDAKNLNVQKTAPSRRTGKAMGEVKSLITADPDVLAVVRANPELAKKLGL